MRHPELAGPGIMGASFSAEAARGAAGRPWTPIPSLNVTVNLLLTLE